MLNPDMTRLQRPSMPIVGPGPVPAFHNEPLIRGPRLQRPQSDTIKKNPCSTAPKPKVRPPAVKRGGSGHFVTKKTETRRTNSDPNKDEQVPMPRINYPNEWPPELLANPTKRKTLRGEESKESS